MGLTSIFGARRWWLFPGYKPKHTHKAIDKRRRIETYAQQKELDNKRKEPSADNDDAIGGGADTAAAPTCNSSKCPGIGAWPVLHYQFNGQACQHCIACVPRVERDTHIFAALSMLTGHITQLEHKSAEQEARHTEQRNTARQYHQTNVDNCRKLNQAKKQMDAQQAQREEQLNAQQARLLALKEELLNHAAVHTVSEEAGCQHCLPARSRTPPM
jgi:hypothetical protein